MACLDMYNSEHKGSSYPPPVSPRISFSNDFAESHQFLKQDRNASREAPVSSDFEFSVTSYSMMSADELFSKGKLLPFRDNGGTQRTLREELLAGDDDRDCGGSPFRPPKGSTRWKGFLGLRRGHVGSSKKAAASAADKSDGFVGFESKKFGSVPEGTSLNRTSQEMLNEGESNCRDSDFGM